MYQSRDATRAGTVEKDARRKVLEAANVQQHVFRFTSAVDAHANVRLTGLKSIQIFGTFETAPATDSDFELLGSTTRMNATLNFPISDAGKSIWYRFRYRNTKDQPAPDPRLF